MNEHSPEAIAAYPDDGNHLDNIEEYCGRERTAFDRGREVTLAATREALADVIDGYLETRRGDDLVNHGETIVDAILAAGIIQEAGKPVVNVEMLAAALFLDAMNWARGRRVFEGINYRWATVPDETREAWLASAAALTAPDGPLRSEREVKAEALGEAVKSYTDDGGHITDVWWLDDRAGEIRAGL